MATPVPSNAGFLSVDTTFGKLFELPQTTDLIGRVITFKDSTGNAQSGAIQISTINGDFFQDGTSLYTIQQAYGSATFVSRSGYWVLQQGNAQVNASSITTNMLNVTGSNIANYMSTFSLYAGYVQADNALVVTNGTLSVGNSNPNSPFNVVLFTDGLQDIGILYGFDTTPNWVTRVASNDSHYGFSLFQTPGEVFTLLSTGRVGIMTSSPMYTLDISGTAFVSSLTISSLNMIDTTTNNINFLTTSSGVLLLNGAGITGGGGGAGVSQIVAGSNISISPAGGTGIVTIDATGGLTSDDLVSSIVGLGTSGYVSTLTLASTIDGLGTSGYVSSLSLTSTFEAIAIGIFSLIDGLGTTGFVSTSQLVSTVDGLGTLGYLSSGGQGYFSSITVNMLPQDAPAWDSNIQVAGNDPEPNPLAVDIFGSLRVLKNIYIGSTTTVIGTAGVATGKISTGTLLTSSLFFYNPTLNEQFPLIVSGSELIFNGAPLMTTNPEISLVSTPVLDTSLASTLQGIGSAGYVSTASLTSSLVSLEYNYQTSGFISTPTLTSTIVGLGSANFVSTASLTSSLVSLEYNYQTSGFLSTPTLTSTIIGLGSLGYLSSFNAFSMSTGRLNTSTLTFIDINTNTQQLLLVSSGTLTLNGQSVGGGGSSGPGGVSIENITSTVTGLGSAGYISTSQLISTTRGLGSAGYLSSFTIPNNLSTMAIFTSSILASTMVTSSLQVNSLTIGTGTGWVNLGPIQTVALSSIQINTGNLYSDNTYIGDVSTLNAIQYYGLFGNYNNTVLAEVSTGAGSQEFLTFKGSSTSDRIRFQTTGAFVVETGVSARLWSNTTVPTLSNVTPAFVINSSSNVGIQTASPGATLDVAGTGRFVTLSSQQLQVSSIQIQSLQLSSLQATTVSSAIATFSTLRVRDNANNTGTLFQSTSFLYYNNVILAGTRIAFGQVFSFSGIPTITTLGVSSSNVGVNYIAYSWTSTSGSNSITVIGGIALIDFLIVAGGGGGGRDRAAGGGAGGLIYTTGANLPAGTYTITVGAGGTGATSGVTGGSGSNSVFNGNTAIGGGGGGSIGTVPGTGGSGGGGVSPGGGVTTAGGAGTSGQGFAGGSGNYTNGVQGAAGGGGGAGSAGSNGTASGGGNGGDGLAISIIGTSVYYAGGGGGSRAWEVGSGGGGLGGLGGGGNAGAAPGAAGSNGTNGLGGGGGGGANQSPGNGGNGGSGIVIVRVYS
jgi:hypothetical protein